MADDTIRKQILDSFINHLKAEAWIVAGDVSVNPGKTRYLVGELPGLSVFAGNEQAAKSAYGKQDCMVPVELKYVGVLSRDGEGVKALAFDLAEDIRGKLIKSAITATLGDLADNMEYTGGDIDYPAAEDQAAQVSVLFNISYETLISDPYSQGE